MTNVYSIEINIVATAYIKAETPEAALVVAEALKGGFLELDEQEDAGYPITGRDYGHPDLPPLSFSPAMTIMSLADEDVTLVEEL